MDNVAVRRTAEAVIERMEFRRLLSATIFGITGAETANEGQNYTLNLSGVGPGASSVDHWAINWGDGGGVQTVSGFPSSVTHAYPDGPAGATITADVVTTDGTLYHARNGPPVNPADLDATFGSGGTTTVPDANAAALGIQSDGKMLVAGSAQNSTGGYDFTVTRYNADGTLDTSFGAGGIATIPFFHNNYRQDAHADALIVLPGGKIVVGGTANYVYPDTGSGSAMALAQLNPDGSIDTGYANSGTQELWIGQLYGFYSHNITALAQQPDGKVVAGGWERSDTFYGSSYRFALARFNADGTPDLGFGGYGIGGTVTQDAYGNAENIARSLALQPDGKIVLGGSGNNHMQVMRFTSAGLPDPTFGSGGDYLDTALAAGYALAVQSDGKIVLAGDDHTDGNTWVRLIRLNADGTADAGFGAGGQVVTWLGFSARGAFGLTVGGDGKLLAAAGGNPTMFSHDFTLLEYNADGSLDPNFGTGGVTTVDGGTSSDDVGVAMGLAPDGKIVVLGTAGFGDPQRGIGPANAELVRFQGAPPPKTIQVLNVAPAPSIGGLTEGGGGSEGVPVTLAASAADAPLDQAAGFTYVWTVTKDGAAFASGTGPGITFTPDDNGSYTVTLNATDRDGATGATQQTLSVANLPPVPTLGGVPAGGIMGEGTTATLTASATDVAPDQAAGFAVAWNVLKNGLPYGSGTGAVYAFLPDDEGTYDVACTVTDKDGGAATVTQRITATNTSPTTVAIGAAAPAVRGQSITLTGSFADPGLLDTHTARWDFGDGTPADDVANADAGLATTHVYAAAGAYTVTLTVTDNGGATTAVTRPVTIDVADLQANPNDPTKTDLVIGGTSGNDTVSVTSATGGEQVTVNGAVAGTFNPTGRIVISGYDGSDDLEVVDATITLPAYLDGGAGDDKLVGGAGADTFVGGAGNDEANFTNHASGVRVTMDGLANDGANSGGEGDNVGSDIEIVAATAYDDYLDASMLTTRIVMNGYGGNNTLVGGSGNDSLYGDGGNNTFYGNAGNDEIFGGSGDDTAYGGDGNDTMYGGAGNDKLIGGAGADYLSGGAGADEVNYNEKSTGVNITLNGLADDGTAGEGDNVQSDFEIISATNSADTVDASSLSIPIVINTYAGNDTITGGSGNDTLYGGDGNDLITGGSGNDAMYGEGGDDKLVGGLGADYLSGGAGTDEVNYNEKAVGVSIKLNGSADDGTAGEGDNVQSDFEIISATNFADTIDASGLSTPIAIATYAGNDLIIGGSGNDGLYGGDGDDKLVGGLGADYLSGGAGIDEVNYNEKATGVNISMNGSADDGTAGEGDNVQSDLEIIACTNSADTVNASSLATPIIINTYAGNDTITGGSGSDTLYGGDGDDTIIGGAGSDTYYGEGGNDKLYARDGVDDARIDGGPGTDQAQVDASPKDRNQISIESLIA